MANTRNFRHPPSVPIHYKLCSQEYFEFLLPSIFKDSYCAFVALHKDRNENQRWETDVSRHSQSLSVLPNLHFRSSWGPASFFQTNVGCSSSTCLPHLWLVSLGPFPFEKGFWNSPLGLEKKICREHSNLWEPCSWGSSPCKAEMLRTNCLALSIIFKIKNQTERVQEWKDLDALRQIPFCQAH